ncbi:MAG: PEP-CTERM sorting domain-containing protein [Isosphaeraceae bacterium]
MKMFRTLLASGILCLASGISANAATLEGTMAFQLQSGSQITVDPDGADLNSIVSVTFGLVEVNGTTGDYTGVPDGTSFGGPITFILAQAGTGFGIGSDLSNAGYGTFTATGPGNIEVQNANSLTLYLEGDFDPADGGPLGAFETTKSSIRVTIVKNGESYSGGFVLSSPPTGTVPEPSSIVLAGLGMAGLGMIRVVRHRASK